MDILNNSKMKDITVGLLDQLMIIPIRANLDYAYLMSATK